MALFTDMMNMDMLYQFIGLAALKFLRQGNHRMDRPKMTLPFGSHRMPIGNTDPQANCFYPVKRECINPFAKALDTFNRLTTKIGRLKL